MSQTNATFRSDPGYLCFPDVSSDRAHVFPSVSSHHAGYLGNPGVSSDHAYALGTNASGATDCSTFRTNASGATDCSTFRSATGYLGFPCVSPPVPMPPACAPQY